MALADRAHKSSGKAFAIDLNQNVIDKILIDKTQKKSSEYGIQVFKTNDNTRQGPHPSQQLYYCMCEVPPWGMSGTQQGK